MRGIASIRSSDVRPTLRSLAYSGQHETFTLRFRNRVPELSRGISPQLDVFTGGPSARSRRRAESNRTSVLHRRGCTATRLLGVLQGADAECRAGHMIIATIREPPGYSRSLLFRMRLLRGGAICHFNDWQGCNCRYHFGSERERIAPSFDARWTTCRGVL